MTKAPWTAGEPKLWEKVAREAWRHHDILIGPYLDGWSVRALVIGFVYAVVTTNCGGALAGARLCHRRP